MIQTGGVGQNRARRLFDDLGGGSALLGGLLQQLVVENLAKLTLPGIVAGQVFAPLHQEFGHLVGEVEHLAGR